MFEFDRITAGGRVRCFHEHQRLAAAFIAANKYINDGISTNIVDYLNERLGTLRAGY